MRYRDGKQVVIGAIMQHIEQAGVHSRRLSLFALPPYNLLDAELQDQIREQVKTIAIELEVSSA